MENPTPSIRFAPAAGLWIAATALLVASLLVTRYGFPPGIRPWRGSLLWLGWLNTAQGTSAALAIWAAAWIIWGTGRLTTRLAVSSASMLLVMLLWQLLFRTPRVPWLRYEQQFLPAVIWLLGVGLVAAAWRFGIRIVDRSGHLVGADPRSRQMSLLGLLALMSGVAIAMAGVRQVIPRNLGEFSITGDDVFAILAQLSGTMLVASTVITCFHVSRPSWLNLLLAGSFMLVIGLLHMAAYGQAYRLTLMPIDPRLQVKGIYFAVLAAWLLAAVLVLQGCGLRLRRCTHVGKLLPLAVTP